MPAVTKKGFNCSLWIKGEGKVAPKFVKHKSNAIAYLTDAVTRMEKGTVTKIEVFYSERQS